MAGQERSNGDITRIIIPSSEIQGWYPDKGGAIIDVVPRDDRWLVSKDRSREEVEAVLVGRLKGTQSMYEQKYEVGGNVAKLLAYVETNAEYNNLKREHTSRAADKRQAYGEEKKKIKDRQISENEKRKLINQKWSEYEPDIDLHSEELKRAGAVKRMFLKEAVLDFFSVSGDGSPLAEGDLSDLILEANSLFNKRPDDFKRLTQDDSINVFLNDLADYLKSTRDLSLFQRTSYRYSPDFISNSEDCLVLGNMVEMATRAGGTEKTNIANRLGWSYLEFLVNRAGSLSNFETGDDKYPYLSLLYDISTATLIKGRGDISGKLEELISGLFNGVVSSHSMKKETIKLIKNHFEQVDSLGKYFVDGIPSAAEILMRDGEPDIDQLPPEFVKFYNSTETRLSILVNVLGGIDSFTGKKLEMLFESSSSRQARKTRKGKYTLTEEATEALYHILFETRHDDDIRRQLGVEVDLGRLWAFNVSYFLSLDRKRRTRYSKALENGALRDLEPAMLLSDRAYLLKGSENLSPKELEKLDGENEILWREVLDNSIWFVSPRGDIFSSNLDIEMGDAELSSIRFDIDRKHPREHRVTITSSDGIESDVFWLDTQRNLLDKNREIVIGDPRIFSKLNNILLRRLYFITSGVLSTKEDPHTENGEDKRFTIEYRRAHYRVLRSTDKRRITMESTGAQVHADQILKEYGINIFKEIERRRNEGSLKWNEFLTFVREVVPEEQLVSHEPNQIIYDPTLVKVPNR